MFKDLTSAGAIAAAAKVISHREASAQALIREYGHALLSGVPALILPKGSVSTDGISDDFRHTVASSYLETDLRTSSSSMVAAKSQSFAAGDYRHSVVGFLTSGTEGRSKGVLYASSTLLACGEVIASAIGLTPHSSALSFAPQEFAFGLSIIHSHLVSGSPVVFAGGCRLPADYDAAMASVPLANLVYMLPLQAALLAFFGGARDERPLHFVVAGGRLGAGTAQRLAARFPAARLCNMYGQSELGPRVAIWEGELAAYVEGNVGRPIEGVRLALASEGSGGEDVLWVASPYKMLRYLGDAERAGNLVGTGSAHWWRTGDLARVSSDGELFVLGRTSQFVKLAGVRVLLSDIEKTVTEVVGVSLCAVSMSSNDLVGDTPTVCVLSATQDAELVQAVRNRLLERLGHVATLIRVELVTELSLDRAGKR